MKTAVLFGNAVASAVQIYKGVNEVDIEKNEIRNLTTGETYKLKPLGDILPILEAGNVFEYAKKVGMIQGEHPEHNPGEEPEKD